MGQMPTTNFTDLKQNAQVRGLIPGVTVTIRQTAMFGEQAMQVTFVDPDGRTDERILFKEQLADLEVVKQSRPLDFGAPGDLFRLVAEAQRLKYGFLFDPMIAVNTSSVDPLPHQITAVYESMLGRQPLRFVLADDPGAGKTIMAGLLIKELIIRGDVAKCLIIAPGGLVEQWQDELDEKFNLYFDILTNEGIQASRSGNWFTEHNLCIARLDKLSRNEDVQQQVANVDWDLIIVDEAHKMAASYFGSEIRYTKRFRLGQKLSACTRQLLLLTATPHNGKDQDFQLFLSLIDGDRFEGKFRDGVRSVDVSDVMRRMVKEQLVTMDGKPLFPDRYAYTVSFPLSPAEAALYREVTNYVREGFNAAERLQNENRKGTVGFALTMLQRRLASSPEAIFQSLRRRRERLEERLREEKLLKRGAEAQQKPLTETPELDTEDIEDLEDAPESDLASAEEQIIDRATASQTIAELDLEIHRLRQLEDQAQKLRNSRQDTKWTRLAETLDDNPEMFEANAARRKLVIFTEHRDTLNYLVERLATKLGSSEAVVTIHGQTPREVRRQVQELFNNDPKALVLVATDAASEGINLHKRAHLMVNYDLPWNPNRLEQRFGRIHRIGQPNICHLWNLVAEDTREGEVFIRLLHKLDEARKALGGRVFDVLGKALKDRSLRDLMIEAILGGERQEVKDKHHAQIDADFSRSRIEKLLEDRSLVREDMSPSKVQDIREQMERAQARKLQPHYIGSFFIEAFSRFHGALQKREPNRYEVRNVPTEIRNRDRVMGRRAPVLRAYERVTFQKEAILVDGKPPAALIAPGHPLLDATVDLIMERYRDYLRQGAVLIDPNCDGADPRILYFLEHAIGDARQDNSTGLSRVISRQIQFIEIDRDGKESIAGFAPYLDYMPATEEQLQQARRLLDEPWLMENLERKALAFAIQKLVPQHLSEVKLRRDNHIAKTMQQVKDRLTREIAYWDHRANELRAKEDAGKGRSNVNSHNARQRANDLAERLKKRMAELELEKKISAKSPNVLGGALVVPIGFFNAPKGQVEEPPAQYGRDNKASELLAMAKVLATERQLGFEPRDASSENRGYDIESRDPKTGHLRFIEVKGRVEGAPTITVTKNEILTALNKPDAYILAVVELADGVASTPTYIRRPFTQDLEFATASVNFHLKELLSRGAPAI
jgi:superfamily II DNA or RNA helicase